MKIIETISLIVETIVTPARYSVTVNGVEKRLTKFLFHNSSIIAIDISLLARSKNVHKMTAPKIMEMILIPPDEVLEINTLNNPQINNSNAGHQKISNIRKISRLELYQDLIMIATILFAFI